MFLDQNVVKVPVIVEPNALIQPWAMMVHLQNANVAHGTMMSSSRLHFLALPTKIFYEKNFVTILYIHWAILSQLF